MVCAAHFVPAQTTPIGAMQVTRTFCGLSGKVLNEQASVTF
jgi:hypothetical protein